MSDDRDRRCSSSCPTNTLPRESGNRVSVACFPVLYNSRRRRMSQVSSGTTRVVMDEQQASELRLPAWRGRYVKKRGLD